MKQRDGAQQRDSEGSLEQETCENMHVFEERVCERGENEAVTTPKKRLVCWRKAWCIWVEDGPHLRTARRRRCAVRAATRAAEEISRSDESSAAEEAPFSKKHVSQ